MVLSIGIGLIRSKAGLGEKKTEPRSLWKTAGSAFAVAWPNPQALIDGTLMLGDFRASLPGGSAPVFYFRVFFSQPALVYRPCRDGSSARQQNQRPDSHLAESYLRHRDPSLRIQIALPIAPHTFGINRRLAGF